MARKQIIQVQLAALAVLTLAVLLRMFGTPGSDLRIVTFSDNLVTDELYHASIEVTEPVSIGIEAVGSNDSGDRMAAYGWIWNRDKRQLVWKLDPEDGETDRRGRVTVHRVVTLEAGVYDIYFSSFGIRAETGGRSILSSLFNRSAQRWRADSRQWKLELQATGSDDRRHILVRADRPAAGSGLSPRVVVWNTGPVRNRESREHLFEVHERVQANVYSLGEIREEPVDYGRIEYLETGETVWQFSAANTEHAGGGDTNRRFAGSLMLEPGKYRALYRTDNTHAYGSWIVNPPHDPAGWGMEIYVADSSTADHFSLLDPWATETPAVELTQLENNRQHEITFSVQHPSRLIVSGLGEGRGTRMVDYGWIEKSGERGRIWQMEMAATDHAGGADRNRMQNGVVDLAAGVYTLGYRTNDSHAYSDWSADPPDHPVRWGVALFLISGEVSIDESDDDPESPVAEDFVADPGIVVEPESAATASVPIPQAARYLRTERRTLVDLTALSNNVRVEQRFDLERETRLHVRAAGEIMLSDRFDYGWIVNTSTGRIVWEMTRRNTDHAGGASKNRIFDGVITLPAGSYIAHFRTDETHAYQSFNDEPPDNPAAWGIRIEELVE